MNTIEVMSCVQYGACGNPAERSCRNHSYRNSSYTLSRKHSSTRTVAAARKRAARVRARRIRRIKFAILGGVLALCIQFAGIISRASVTRVPDEYKYYDTITVAYQQDLDDILEQYCDDRYYHSEDDYIRELCRINNLEYDSDSDPVIPPGTHLVVPYYSAEIK